MKFVLFYHSALSDWNHGNAHFLRGVAVDLQSRGHDVVMYEPRDAWSAANLVADHGEAALYATQAAYPTLRVERYGPELDLDRALDGADVVIVHEWNPHDLVRHIGKHHARRGQYVLLFHDTHHRSVTEAESMAAYDLQHYDGVLAFGEVIRQRYLEHGWAARAWTWHEAADTRVFAPLQVGLGSHPSPKADLDGGAQVGLRSQASPKADLGGPPTQGWAGDLVWIGNWGDDERSAELREFLVDPVRELGLGATVHGVRYPQQALEALAAAGIRYAGWLPNYRVPDVFARHRVTVHVPRRPYVETLRGIPTIRPFEALACGIPLVSAPWPDEEGLFRPGVDYLVARNGAEMTRHLRDVLGDPQLARALAASGRETILARHSCAHRVDELLAIVSAVAPASTARSSVVSA